MKQLKNFLENTPLWQIVVLGCWSCFLFCIFIFWKILRMPINDSIVVATFSGLFYGLMVLIWIYFNRANKTSTNFWVSVMELEYLTDEAKTVEELVSILTLKYPVVKMHCPEKEECRLEMDRVFTKISNKYYYLKICK